MYRPRHLNNFQRGAPPSARAPWPSGPPMAYPQFQSQQVYYGQPTFNQFHVNQHYNTQNMYNTQIYNNMQQQYNSYSQTGEGPPNSKRTLVPVGNLENNFITPCQFEPPPKKKSLKKNKKPTSQIEPPPKKKSKKKKPPSSQIEPPLKDNVNDPSLITIIKFPVTPELIKGFAKYQPPDKSEQAVSEALQNATAKFTDFPCGSVKQKSRRIGIEDAVGSIYKELLELHYDYQHLFYTQRTSTAIKQAVRDRIKIAVAGKMENWGDLIKAIYYDTFPCSREMLVAIAERHRGVYFRMNKNEKKKTKLFSPHPVQC